MPPTAVGRPPPAAEGHPARVEEACPLLAAHRLQRPRCGGKESGRRANLAGPPAWVRENHVWNDISSAAPFLLEDFFLKVGRRVADVRDNRMLHPWRGAEREDHGTHPP